MIKSIRVELSCYLEGVEIDILDVSITNTINAPTVAQIRLPSVKEVSGILRRTIVEIYYTDYETNTQRLLFQGEVTGRSYSKHQGTPVRTLYAMSALNNLNDLPSQYLNTMSLNGASYEYQFYNIPLDETLDYMVNKDLYVDFDIDKDAGNNILEFVDAFLKMAIGESAFENYYKNVGSRHRIKENHVLIETDMYKTLMDAVQRNNIIKDIKSGMTYTKKVLDTLIKYLAKYRYIYISMTSPSYNIGGNYGIADNTDSDVVLSKYYPNGLTSYIIMPNCINMIPPKCNVIYADRSVQMSVTIRENTITRLLNIYHIFNESDPEYPVAASIYPLSLSKKVAEKGLAPFGNGTLPEDYDLTEDEASTGMIPFSQKKDYIYDILMRDSLIKTGNELKSKKDISKENQGYFNNDTAYDFHLLKHRDNVITITLYGFNPYIVCGLSCIVYDPDGDVYYYGNIVSKTQSINIEQGSSTVTIRMINAREIEDIRDITSELDNEGQYIHTKIMSVLPPEVYCPFNSKGEIVLNGSGSSRLTEEFYSLILRGSQSLMLSNVNRIEKAFGWQSVVDERDDDEEPVDAGSILNIIKSKLENTNSNYGKREIATVSEVKHNIYNDNLPVGNDDKGDPYLDERTDFITISDLVNEKYDKSDGKSIYVQERRDAVLLLYRAISKRIVSSTTSG